MKKYFVTIICLIFILASYAGSIQADESSNDTIYVDDDGGEDFTYIQDAIDAANPGDTIYVYAGTYLENLVIDKSLNLIGENKENTIIEGTGDADVIFANDVEDFSICFFTIRSKKGESYSGIKLAYYADFNYIHGNCIYDVSHGITVTNSNKNIISNNTIYSVESGIVFSSISNVQSNNSIKFNVINNSNIGCSIFHSLDNEFYGNVFLKNNVGLKVIESGRNKIYMNDFFGNNKHASDENPLMGSNSWYNNSLKNGNFFDDYTGSDNDGDGVGDSPYNVSGNAGSKDLYPLMMPFSDINFPPYNPTIQGPLSGKIEEEHLFSIYSHDLNGDDLYYLIDWGDGISTGWEGPFPSATEQTFSHTWFEKGEYSVRVRCKDEDGLLTDWTELPVSMPRSKSVSWLFFDFIADLLNNFSFFQFVVGGF